jgi:hypothetical protein
MSVIGSNVLAGASSGNQLTVERSYAFNSLSDAYFNRFNTNSYAAWTFSFWIKGLPTVSSGVFSSTFSGSTDFGRIYFDASRRLRYTETYSSVTTVDCFIPSVHVDPSAWTHYVISTSRQAAGAVADRIQIYVNGVQQTLDGTSVFPQFANSNIGRQNTSYAIGVLREFVGSVTGPIAGIWLTEAQLVTSFSTLFKPTAFGTTNSANQWSPIPYRGTYGAGSFYLKFNDATSATTLGNDSSGLSANFSAGPGITTANSVFDTPTPNGTRGNYPVWDTQAQSTGIDTYNLLRATTIAGAYTATTPVQVATIPMAGNKFYAELTITTVTATTGVSVYFPATNRVPLFGDNNVTYSSNGQVTVNGVLVTTVGTFTTGSIVGIAVDASSTPNAISFYVNNVLRTTVNATTHPTMVAPYYLAVSDTNAAASAVITANFGQSAFTYTPPAGFNPINTQYTVQGEMTYSGTFTGNANVNGPYIYLNGAPQRLTINGNTVVFGTTVQRSAKGFKIITADAGYNSAGLNLYDVVAGSPTFKYGRGQINP